MLTLLSIKWSSQGERQQAALPVVVSSLAFAEFEKGLLIALSSGETKHIVGPDAEANCFIVFM
jgi:hypothetical protein